MEYANQLRKHLTIILNAPTISCIVCKTFKRNQSRDWEIEIRLEFNQSEERKSISSLVKSCFDWLNPILIFVWSCFKHYYVLCIETYIFLFIKIILLF